MPALVTDHGVLTETVAILGWIAQAYPAAKLAPTGPFPWRRRSRSTAICARPSTWPMPTDRGYRWADEESSFEDMRRKVRETMAECFALIDREILKGP